MATADGRTGRGPAQQDKAIQCGRRARLGCEEPCYQAASAVTPMAVNGLTATSAASSYVKHDHRPARPAPHGAGRQAEASRRGVAIGPRGCQAVPRAGAERPKAPQDFVSSQVFSP